MKNAQQFGSPDATPVAGRTEVTQCPTSVAHPVLPYGTKLRDNDPRMNGRVLTLTGSRDAPRVFVTDGTRYFRINRSRIYTDGKPRKSGFSVIEMGAGFTRFTDPPTPNEYASLRAQRDELLAALKKVNQELWSKSVSVRRRPTLDELRAMFLDTRDALEGIK